MKRSVFVILVCLSLGEPLFSQDFTFSQFYEMPILRNPSLAGVFTGDIRVAGIYRSQWESITVPFQTSAFSIEYKLPNIRNDNLFTIGAQIAHDQAGDIKLKRTQFLPVINFHKSLSGNVNNYLSMAFMGGPVQTQFDPSQAQLDDQFVNGAFSPSNISAQTFNSTARVYWDLSAGVTYSGEFSNEGNFYVGVGIFHVFTPNVGFFSIDAPNTLSRKWTLNAGLTTPLSETSNLVAFADYFIQGGNKQFLGGALLEKMLKEYDESENMSISAGAFYRWNDAFIPVIKLNMHNFVVGLSYDVNVSKLRTVSELKGGFELTLSFKSFLNSNNSTRYKLRCVSFGDAVSTRKSP